MIIEQSLVRRDYGTENHLLMASKSKYKRTATINKMLKTFMKHVVPTISVAEMSVCLSVWMTSYDQLKKKARDF